MGRMELFRVGPNQNRTPLWGLRKLGPERRGKQGELAGTWTCLEVHPEGLVGSVANAGSHDPAHIL
jgi:hypothetical protein